MHIWAINVHVQFKFLADGFDVLQAFLVVGASAANPDVDLVLDQSIREFSQSADDALEC